MFFTALAALKRAQKRHVAFNGYSQITALKKLPCPHGSEKEKIQQQSRTS